MGSLKLLGLPDLFAGRYATAVAASEASASLGAANLVTEEPSEFWRSTALTPVTTAFRLMASPAGSRTFTASGAGVVGTNLSLESGFVRFLACEALLPTLLADAFEVLVPVEIVDSNGVSAGDVDSINNGFTPSGLWITGGSGTFDVLLRFDTPATAPRVGSQYQTIWIWVDTTVATGPQEAATVTVKTYRDSGSGAALVATLATKPVTATGGQWLCFPFDYSATDYGSDGSELRIGVEIQAGTTGTCRLGEVVFFPEGTYISGSANVAADSGWLAMGTPAAQPGAGVDYLSNELGAYTSKLHDFEAEHDDLVAIWVLLREDHVAPLSATGEEGAIVSADPLTYVEVGKGVGGIVWTIDEGFRYGSYIGVEDLSSQESTEEGQEFGSRRGTRLVADLEINPVSKEKAAFVFDRIFRKKGVLSPFLVSANHGDSVEESMTTFYATLRSNANSLASIRAGGERRTLTLPLEEKL